MPSAQVPIQGDIFWVGQKLVAFDLLPDMTWRGWSLDSQGSLIVLIHGELFDHILGSLHSYFSEIHCWSGLWKYLCNLKSHSQWRIVTVVSFQYGFRSFSSCLYSSTHLGGSKLTQIFLASIFLETWSGWMSALRFKVKGCSWKVQNSKFLGRWRWNVNRFVVLNEKKSISRSQVDTDLYSGNPWSYMGIIERDNDNASWFP